MKTLSNFFFFNSFTSLKNPLIPSCDPSLVFVLSKIITSLIFLSSIKSSYALEFSLTRIETEDDRYRDLYESVFGSIPTIPLRPVSATPLGNEPQRTAWSELSPAQQKDVNQVFPYVPRFGGCFRGPGATVNEPWGPPLWGI